MNLLKLVDSQPDMWIKNDKKVFDVFGSCFGVGILCGNQSALACLRRCIGSMGLSKTAIMRMPRVLESTNRDRQRERVSDPV